MRYRHREGTETSLYTQGGHRDESIHTGRAQRQVYTHREGTETSLYTQGGHRDKSIHTERAQRQVYSHRAQRKDA